ncbi:hypothetical protein CD351_00440 [Erythrobacter sp. KY5]|uniref:peptidylprolyl isomerase n=1 Tax=Erythrobacter sp. KY5 TaxID=2011159 RepID=UPI000DBEF8CC|nr:peptidylprolyl isomerase [Erythrobacter sp. KY5]AWW72889.1 hypothetical protein CD351_00440 [Erythrobacter sp. KY5]
MTLPGWAREPLIHFLALGAIIYVALTWGGTPVDPASRIITVGPERQAQLAFGFERMMGRAPTDAELDAAIDRYVRDEVLYREALRLGLDQGDAVVRQRMVSKMDMSASLAAELADPSEALLRSYFEENAAQYAGEPRLTFEQALFATERDARRALAAGSVEGSATSLPKTVTAMSASEVQARFGEQFGRNLAELETDDAWQGPIPSGFGWHLVRFTQRTAQDPKFEAVREQVVNDWRSAETAARKERAFEVLQGAYRIEIDR